MKAGDFKCYSCDARHFWCYDIESVENQGDNAKKSCLNDKCAIIGKQ